MEEKNLGILCLTLIAVGSLWAIPAEAVKVVLPIVTGISGLVVGNMLPRGE